MATKTVSTGWSAGTSGFDSLLTNKGGDKFYSIPISTINTAIKNAGLPANAVISDVSLTATATASNNHMDGRYYLSIGYGGSGSISTAFFTGDPIAYDARSGSITRTVSLNAALSNNSINTSKGSYITFRIYSTTYGKKTYEIKDVNLTITYSIPTYTVTWKNHDGSVLETDTGVSVGTTPTYNGSTPTKASTAQYDYTFSGWSPSVGAITGNTTYTAQFTQTLRSYAVIFKDENGATLKTETVSYGSKPTPPSNPTKADTAQWDYTFDGWYDAIGNKWTSDTVITSDTVFTARYTAVVQKYTITASGTNGTVTGGGTYDYNSNVTLTATPNSGYKFKQWSDGVTSATRTVTVTGAATYTAVFELIPPEIKLVQMIYLDKQISATNKVPCGEGFIISVELS